MEDKLVKALESTGLDVFMLERPEMLNNCIVYTYSENDLSYSDDEADIEEYTIYVNLYCESGLNKYKKLIRTAMKSEGFVLGSVSIPYKGKEIPFIQQAFTFYYVAKIN